MREGTDISSFDLKMVVCRSIVRDRVWVVTFFIRKYASFYALKQGKDFFFEETMCKFPVLWR